MEKSKKREKKATQKQIKPDLEVVVMSISMAKGKSNPVCMRLAAVKYANRALSVLSTLSIDSEKET